MFRHMVFKMPIGHASVDIEKAMVLLVVSKVDYYTSGVYRTIHWVWAKHFPIYAY